MIKRIKKYIWNKLPKVKERKPFYADNVKYIIPTYRLATIKEIVRKQYDIQR